MENELKQNLLKLSGLYGTAAGASLATVGRQAAGDWRFFDRLCDDTKTFTARKYDEIIRWFSLNWPADVGWPAEIERPKALNAEQVTS